MHVTYNGIHIWYTYICVYMYMYMYVCTLCMYAGRCIYGHKRLNGVISLARQGAIPRVVHSVEDLL